MTINILVLGDIFGQPGINIIVENLPKIIKEQNINFVVANGENAAENGLGITGREANLIFNSGVDVITSGNHIWDKKEIIDVISNDIRILRPANLPLGSPGKGYGFFKTKCKKFTVAVINLMGNVFMKKSDNVFDAAKLIQEKILLKKNADFIIVDFHGETTSEKQAMGFFFDGKATALVGTHTHVPTADTRVLEKGTGYQTDIGMCGDYNSVIGMDKVNSILNFLKEKKAKKNFPANGEPTISGVVIKCNVSNGLCEKINRIMFGNKLT